MTSSVLHHAVRHTRRMGSLHTMRSPLHTTAVRHALDATAAAPRGERRRLGEHPSGFGEQAAGFGEQAAGFGEQAAGFGGEKVLAAASNSFPPLEM